MADSIRLKKAIPTTEYYSYGNVQSSIQTLERDFCSDDECQLNQINGLYWPSKRSERLLLGEADVKETLIQKDAAECPIFPIPDAQIMDLRGN